jgi:hypothetical protein
VTKGSRQNRCVTLGEALAPRAGCQKPTSTAEIRRLLVVAVSSGAAASFGCLSNVGGGLLASSPWSQCFSQSYASILPTSLGHIHPIDQRLFTSESWCGFRYGLCAREEVDLRQSFHENNPGHRTIQKLHRFLYVFRRLSPTEMSFEASATSKRKENSPQTRLPFDLPLLTASQPQFPAPRFRNFGRIPFPPTPGRHPEQARNATTGLSKEVYLGG